MRYCGVHQGRMPMTTTSAYVMMSDALAATIASVPVNMP